MISEGSGRGGSGCGTRVHPWWIYVDVWQNQCSIVKKNKVKIKIKKECKQAYSLSIYESSLQLENDNRKKI